VVVEETFKYAATPDDNETATAAWGDIQTCREVYNHALTQEYRPRPDYDKPSYRDMQNKLTGSDGWKNRWPEWKNVYSKCLQMAVRRIKQSENVLDSLKTRGYPVVLIGFTPICILVTSIWLGVLVLWTVVAFKSASSKLI